MNFEEEIDLVLEHIFKFVFNDNCLPLFYIIGFFFKIFLIRRPTFEPQLESISKLNDVCKLLLKFCKTKEQFGASPQDIKVNNKIMYIITCYFLSEIKVILFFRIIFSIIYVTTIYLWT